jgi:nitrite reductase/ring-hydroxylating ferredoxin subunit
MAGREYAVCRSQDLPPGGSFLALTGGRELGVFNLGGEYFALPSVCPHQNGPLCRGRITGTIEADEASGWRRRWVKDGEIVVCPWHFREFDIRSGSCLANSRQRVPVYRGRVVEDYVVIMLPR